MKARKIKLATFLKRTDGAVDYILDLLAGQDDLQDVKTYEIVAKCMNYKSEIVEYKIHLDEEDIRTLIYENKRRFIDFKAARAYMSNSSDVLSDNVIDYFERTILGKKSCNCDLCRWYRKANELDDE